MDDSPFEGGVGGCPCVNWTTSSNTTVPALPSATQLASRAQGPSPPAKKTEAKHAAVAKYRLAESLLQQGKAGEAAEALNAAIQLQPDFVEAHFVLGVLLARQGRENYGGAVDQFLAVLRLDPKHVDARINLSNMLEQEGVGRAHLAVLLHLIAQPPGGHITPRVGLEPQLA